MHTRLAGQGVRGGGGGGGVQPPPRAARLPRTHPLPPERRAKGATQHTTVCVCVPTQPRGGGEGLRNLRADGDEGGKPEAITHPPCPPPHALRGVVVVHKGGVACACKPPCPLCTPPLSLVHPPPPPPPLPCTPPPQCMHAGKDESNIWGFHPLRMPPCAVGGQGRATRRGGGGRGRSRLPAPPGCSARTPPAHTLSQGRHTHQREWVCPPCPALGGGGSLKMHQGDTSIGATAARTASPPPPLPSCHRTHARALKSAPRTLGAHPGSGSGCQAPVCAGA